MEAKIRLTPTLRVENNPSYGPMIDYDGIIEMGAE
jgi:hypothetical protein